MDYCTNVVTAQECKTFYTDTTSAAVLGTIGGVISAIFSVITVVIIFRSRLKLASIYHRIMLMMSLMDIMNDLAISLTTLPMPRDRIYPYPGISIGTAVTCDIQGFAHVAGTGGSFFYSCGLSLFYLCLIQFRMSDRNIKRFIEPLIHLFGFVLPLTNASIFWYLKLMNPAPYESWCTVANYPYRCKEYDIECVRGSTAPTHLMTVVIAVLGASVLFGGTVILCCMGWIICGARNNRWLEEDNVPTANSSQPAWNSLKKTLVKQALIYVTGFFFVFTFPGISLLYPNNRTVLTLRIIFLPLQGFTNSAIFIYLKVQNMLLEYEDVKVMEALFYVILSPKTAPEIRISGITKVTIDMTRKENRGNMIDSFEDDNADVSVKAASKNVHMSGFSEEVSFMVGRKWSSGNRKSTEKEFVFTPTNNISSGNISSGNLLSTGPSGFSSNNFPSGLPEGLSYGEEDSSNVDLQGKERPIDTAISKSIIEVEQTGSNITVPLRNRPLKLPVTNASV
mmetsp:Transcript_4846/g.7159  ORF Transcript_4846/g.7159 Transcript_4846/m.7159 type:complete len:508 (-) Transcript_4846:147-1670(-)